MWNKTHEFLSRQKSEVGMRVFAPKIWEACFPHSVDWKGRSPATDKSRISFHPRSLSPSPPLSLATHL